MEPKEAALDFNLKYWQKRGEIISLKNGFYLLRERLEKEADKETFWEYLANKLLCPSYVSLEYVLQKYALLAEAVYGITSITTKAGRVFTNDLTSFSYFSIRPELFLGFTFKNFYNNRIMIASKAKALFDFLYLRGLKLKYINEKMFKELRINWENFEEKDFQEFLSYVRLCQSKKMAQIKDLVKKMTYA